MSKRSFLSLSLVFLLMGAITLLGYAFYVGLFDTVTVSTRRFGPAFLVYQTQKGDYRQTGRTVGELMRELQALGVADVKGFAIYYDDPAKVAPEALRSEAGVILTDGDRLKAAGVVSRYESRMFPVLEGASATFPLRNSMGFFLGAYKVYPKLVQYVLKAGHTPGYSLEVYEIGKTITYFMPFSDQKI